jgi:hypothetical protein
VIGLPLVATWSESDELFGKVRTYCHCFFGLADGGALAFFQFASKDDERTFSPPIAETPFHHIALKVDKITQEEIEKRINGAGYTEPDTFVLEHAIAARSISKTPTVCSSNSRSMLPTQEAFYRYMLFDVWSPLSQRLRVACASALRSLAIWSGRIRRGISYYPNRPTNCCSRLPQAYAAYVAPRFQQRLSASARNSSL